MQLRAEIMLIVQFLLRPNNSQSGFLNLGCGHSTNAIFLKYLICCVNVQVDYRLLSDVVNDRQSLFKKSDPSKVDLTQLYNKELWTLFVFRL